MINLDSNTSEIINFANLKYNKNEILKSEIKMKVVILAGGKGSRISEYTKKIPKPMIKILNKTILEHIIEIYAKQSFKDFYILTGYKGDLIKKYFNKYRLGK